MRALCTISDSGYAAQSILLLSSAKQHNPDLELFYVCIDGGQVSYPNLEINQLPLEFLFENFEELAFLKEKYDVIEFSTSIKPRLLKFLIKRNFNSVMYLDPDISVYSSLNAGFEIAETHGIALTPHRLSPSRMGADESLELNFLSYGVFNLGFVAVGQDSLGALNWWEKKTTHFSDRKPFLPQFTDQKWANLFPAYFETSIVRHPGYNVAPWNLDERNIHFRDKLVMVNEKWPLVFVHYSQSSNKLTNGNLSVLWQEFFPKPLSESERKSVLRLIGEYNYRLSVINKLLRVELQKKSQQNSAYLSLHRFRSFAIIGFKVGLQKDAKRLCHKLILLASKIIKINRTPKL